MSKVLLTGGAGYIGTHTAIELINAGYEVIVVDNLVNSSEVALKRVKEITDQEIPFINADVKNSTAIGKIFKENSISAVIHFAGLKAVGESVKLPLKYYENNLISTLVLLQEMEKANVKKLVFSSSATVYGTPSKMPINESDNIGIGLTNPYGKTKYMIEEMLMDLAATNANWQLTSLRYFNPIGAHESGLIGEDPNDIPNNLMPYISQVAIGKLPHLSVFGNDYPTKDGTGVRDYIHVVDLAKAHVAAINTPSVENEYRALNIGTGIGTSVFELISAFEKANSVKIPYIISPRRNGDIATCYADPHLANTEINWQAEKTILDACKDSWNWQSKNPTGYNI